MTRTLLLSVALFAALPSFAEPAADVEAELTGAEKSPSALDRPFSFGSYATGWGGAYGGAGVGGRLRWETFRYVGLDLFGEALVVQTPNGIRHDHPIGFNLYVPVRLTERFQLRPLLGMCAVLSFIEPTEQGAPRADDVLLGAHLGLGAEYALGSWVSLFAEVQGVGWAGHDRSVGGWTGSVAGDVKPFFVAQTMLGAAVHFGWAR